MTPNWSSLKNHCEFWIFTTNIYKFELKISKIWLEIGKFMKNDAKLNIFWNLPQNSKFFRWNFFVWAQNLSNPVKKAKVYEKRHKFISNFLILTKFHSFNHLKSFQDPTIDFLTKLLKLIYVFSTQYQKETQHSS